MNGFSGPAAASTISGDERQWREPPNALSPRLALFAYLHRDQASAAAVGLIAPGVRVGSRFLFGAMLSG
jgi:hypothetical protein